MKLLTVVLFVLFTACLSPAQTGPQRSRLPITWVQCQTCPPIEIPTAVSDGDFVFIALHCPYEHCGLPEFNYTNRLHAGIKFGELGPPVDSDDSHAYQFFMTWVAQTGLMKVYIPVPVSGIRYEAVIEVTTPTAVGTNP
jgi:hypothetical protein